MEGNVTKAIFTFNSVEFGVDNSNQLVMTGYCPNMNQERVSFQTNSSELYLRMFFEFIAEGKVPNEYKDQIEVFEIIKRSKCHFSVFDSFRMRIEALLVNGFLIHKDKLYKINIGSMYLHSLVYQEHFRYNNDEIFRIPDNFERNIVEIMLDMIHSRLIIPEIENFEMVYEICNYFGCRSLCALINNSSYSYILSLVLHMQKEVFFESLNYEQIMSSKLTEFLKFDDFCHLNLGILCRIFQNSNFVFGIDSIKPFFEKCVQFHGSQSSILLSLIQFEKAQDFEELLKFLQVFSTENSDFFSKNIQYLNEFSETFTQMKETINILTEKLNNLTQNVEQKNHIILLKESEISELRSQKNNLENQCKSLKKWNEEQEIRNLEEKKRQEEQEVKRKEEERIKAEQQKKEQEEYEKYGKWRTTQPPDFDNNIINAAQNGKLSSVVYLLAHGTSVNSKDSSIEFLYLIILLFIELLIMVILVLLNI